MENGNDLSQSGFCTSTNECLSLGWPHNNNDPFEMLAPLRTTSSVLSVSEGCYEHWRGRSMKEALSHRKGLKSPALASTIEKEKFASLWLPSYTNHVLSQTGQEQNRWGVNKGDKTQDQDGKQDYTHSTLFWQQTCPWNPHHSAPQTPSPS